MGQILVRVEVVNARAAINVILRQVDSAVMISFWLDKTIDYLKGEWYNERVFVKRVQIFSVPIWMFVVDFTCVCGYYFSISFFSEKQSHRRIHNSDYQYDDHNEYCSVYVHIPQRVYRP